MNCRNVSSCLSAYIDREVELGQLEQIEQHLTSCWKCRQEETELRNLKALIGNAECPHLDPEFEIRLQSWLSDPEKSCPKARSVRSVSLWVLAPTCFAIIWIATDSVRIKPTVSAAKSKESIATGLTRDQLYDLNASQPEYGAPVITAVSYVH